jgi:hypothetical protein
MQNSLIGILVLRLVLVRLIGKGKRHLLQERLANANPTCPVHISLLLPFQEFPMVGILAEAHVVGMRVRHRENNVGWLGTGRQNSNREIKLPSHVLGGKA